jgi:hypothetical protein
VGPACQPALKWQKIRLFWQVGNLPHVEIEKSFNPQSLAVRALWIFKAAVEHRFVQKVVCINEG